MVVYTKSKSKEYTFSVNSLKGDGTQDSPYQVVSRNPGFFVTAADAVLGFLTGHSVLKASRSLDSSPVGEDKKND